VPEAGAGELAGPVVSPDGLVEIHPAGGFPASRRLAPAPLWGGEGPGQATRIEFCVNPLGEIVAARVVRSSGSRPADAAALATVRECLFEPVAGARAADRLRPDALRWTLATVHPAIPTPTTTTTPATR
jgi:TonB family protein